ncbi:MAG TPA: CYTH domain-containing protein [Phycisphaerales bacterium]|nr:CYTH domain-containing protein [Phycisphaerales bacterium]
MAREIERKFLVRHDGWKDAVSRQVHYRQGYLASDGRVSIRVRVSDARAHLNIKSATLGVERLEYEYEIPLDEAHELLDRLADGPLIEKTRYYIEAGTHTWEVDVFEGDNQGLVVAEIELASPDEAFDRPDWIGEEVSHDPRYYNVCLVRNPYRNWDA